MTEKQTGGALHLTAPFTSSQVYRKELRPDHPDVGMVLHQLGTVFMTAEQPEQALQYFQEVREWA